MKTQENKFFIAAMSLLLATILACSASPLPFLLGTPTPLPSPTSPPSPTPEPTATTVIPIDIKVVSSLPMTGNSGPMTQSIVNAEKLRLEQNDYLACGGKYAISYEAWDDGSGAQGFWDPRIETQNAMNAAADGKIIAYLGTFNSGAAKLSIPILNKAGPLVMISPANTYPGLTKQVHGVPDEPEIFYPTGIRNYTRVTTSDDVQGAVAARYLKNELGVNTVYIVDDSELYGIVVADAFEKQAKGIGLTVLGHKSINPQAENYRALMTAIATSNHGKPPDAIYASMVTLNNAAQLLKDKVHILGDNTKVKFVGPDGIQTQSFIDEAGATTAGGVYASVEGLPLASLNTLGQQFIRDYDAKYGALNQPYAVYGYETMSVLLKAIEDVCASGGDPTDRKTVRDAVFAVRDFKGVLGTWSFDENGDTTLTDMTFYQVRNGEYVAIGVYK